VFLAKLCIALFGQSIFHSALSLSNETCSRTQTVSVNFNYFSRTKHRSYRLMLLKFFSFSRFASFGISQEKNIRSCDKQTSKFRIDLIRQRNIREFLHIENNYYRLRLSASISIPRAASRFPADASAYSASERSNIGIKVSDHSRSAVSKVSRYYCICMFAASFPGRIHHGSDRP